MGVTLILGWAIIRVYSFATPAFAQPLDTFKWIVLLAWCIFMLLTEGYYGFQKKFSPRVVARAQHVAAHGNVVDTLFAPFFCMGYFHTSRKRMISTYILTFAIILFIVAVSQLKQPWRGITDLGVLLGLTYGLLWIYIYVFLAFRKQSGEYVANPEVE